MPFAITGPNEAYRFGDANVPAPEFFAGGAAGSITWESSEGEMSPSSGASSTLSPENHTAEVVITATDHGTDPVTVATTTLQVEATLPAIADWGVESDINPAFEVSIPELGPPRFREIQQTAQWPLTFRTRKYEDYATVRDFLLLHQALPFWIEDFQLGELRKVYLDSAFRRIGRRTNWLEYSFQVRDYDYHGPANVADIGPFAPRPPALYSIRFSDDIFEAALSTVSKVLFTLAPGQRVAAVKIAASAAFAGAGITEVTVSVGSSTPGNGAYYAPPWDIFQDVGETYEIEGLALDDSNGDIVLVFTANTLFGDGAATVLSAGVVDVWITTETIP